ncbi:MerR family DNA-binding protein [Paraburkholderia sp. RL18-085-BIA-A]|uniref:MerR family DNA-binding protein n=1 Tax=Paraburkholderia sp. RL18-085-BIA-A TaxID=3031633 RepID=UPI0038BE0B45
MAVERLDWLQFVMRLRATGMPIPGMRAFAQLRAQGDATIEEWRKLVASRRVATRCLSAFPSCRRNSAIIDKIHWYENAAKCSGRHVS